MNSPLAIWSTEIGWTPYDGREITGAVVRTIVRGTDVYANGKVVGSPGHGRHVKAKVQK